jgi:hypothetical protein
MWGAIFRFCHIVIRRRFCEGNAKYKFPYILGYNIYGSISVGVRNQSSYIIYNSFPWGAHPVARTRRHLFLTWDGMSRVGVHLLISGYKGISPLFLFLSYQLCIISCPSSLSRPLSVSLSPFVPRQVPPSHEAYAGFGQLISIVTTPIESIRESVSFL